MATPTYALIDSVVLTSTASSITFSSISGDGAGDLALVINPKSQTATGYGGAALIRINGDATSSYDYVFMGASGSSTSRGGGTTNSVYGGYQSNLSYNTSFTGHFIDFAANNKHKMVLTQQGHAEGVIYARSFRWGFNTPITSLEITASGGDFAADSSFYLYQIVSE